MSHHQESDGVHAQFAGVGNVLLGNIRLGAMGGDTDTARARLESVGQFVLGAYARQLQDRYLGMLDRTSGSNLTLGARA